MSDDELINKARVFAQKKHQGQLCKGATAPPYFDHVAHVARIVENCVGSSDPSLIAAAYLHDVIEDSDATSETLAFEFNDDVANLVSQLTDKPGLTEDARRQAQIDHAPDLSPRAKLIKIADKIANLAELERDPPANWPLAQQWDYMKWGEAVFQGLQGQSAALDKLFDETVIRLKNKLKSQGSL